MGPEVIDIRRKGNSCDLGINYDMDLGKQIRTGLLQSVGKKWLPTMVLYDEQGMQLYDNITTNAPEYYLFAVEENILKDHAREIVQVMHMRDGSKVTPGEAVLELGAGAMRKTSWILEALSKLIPNTTFPPAITYYALDLEKHELERALGQLAMSDIGPKLEGKIATKGLCATYEIGLSYIENGDLYMHGNQRTSYFSSCNSLTDSLSNKERSRLMDQPATSWPCGDSSQPRLHILFLGSSLGNFKRGEDIKFLRSLPLHPGDTLLLGLDHDNSPEKIEIAYNDPAGHTQRFIMNGLRNAGRILGDENLFDQDQWEYVRRYNVANAKGPQILRDPSSTSVFTFSMDELINVEVSYKYSTADAYRLFTEGNLRVIQRWTDGESLYSLWLLERPPFVFPLLSNPTDNGNGPRAVQPVRALSPLGIPTIGDWEAMWELWDLITLRMIPSSTLDQKHIDLHHNCLFCLGVVDIHLSRLFNEPEPDYVKSTSEHGAFYCHRRVRRRLTNLYSRISSGLLTLNNHVGRVLSMTYRREAWHAEILLYMLLQQNGSGTIPIPGFSPPAWEALASSWNSVPMSTSTTVTMGPAIVSIGHDDTEVEKAEMVDVYELGWEDEHPKRDVHVAAFRIDWRPVSNGQFYEFYNGAGKDRVHLPTSWVKEGNDVRVRTFYGPVSMAIACHWPVVTSYDDLSTYATARGGRIPTEAQLRLFYDKFDVGYECGANVGFRHWHPIPATTGREKEGGKGHNGGVWEWTSTVFEKVNGCVPSALHSGLENHLACGPMSEWTLKSFTRCSPDFFEGHEHVVIGGSCVTPPRVAQRRVVNSCQCRYPCAWVGARVAYELEA